MFIARLETGSMYNRAKIIESIVCTSQILYKRKSKVLSGRDIYSKDCLNHSSSAKAGCSFLYLTPGLSLGLMKH